MGNGIPFDSANKGERERGGGVCNWENITGYYSQHSAVGACVYSIPRGSVYIRTHTPSVNAGLSRRRSEAGEVICEVF